MQLLDGKIVYSASDLIGHGACSHMTALSIAYKLDLVDIEPVEIEGMAAIAAVRGGEHEANVLLSLKDQGRQVTDLTGLPNRGRAELVESALKTIEALDRGDDIVYQGIFFDGIFLGYPDFLIRIDDSKYERGFTYEVWDAKLKRSLSAHAVLQMAAYSRQLSKLGFEHAEQMHAYLGDMSIADFLVTEALPYLEKLTEEYENMLLSKPVVPSPIWAAKKSACEMCKWSGVCEAGREEVRDLSLVAKMRADQRKQLISAGVSTVEALATASDESRPNGIGIETFERLRHQAQMQSQQDADTDRKVTHEVFSDQGLALLPKPSIADIWFDMEGDPFALAPNGLEYLFGSITHDTGSQLFTGFWAHTAVDEKKAFEEFVDWVESRRATWPDLHVYHYASYERTRMANLASRYATREAIVDDWFRNGILVDLLKVVQQSIRVSQRSYSIKKLEPLYGFTRSEDVQTAGDSVVDYEKYLELSDQGKTDEAQSKLRGIEDYNKADCLSTRELDIWLRQIALERKVPFLEFEIQKTEDREPPNEKELREALIKDVPISAQSRNPEQHARALLAAAVGYHNRESKVQWWEYFNIVDGTHESWVGQDKVATVTSASSTDWIPPTGRQRSARREITVIVEGGEGLRIGGARNFNVLFDTFPNGYENPLNTARYAVTCEIREERNNKLVITILQSNQDPNWVPLPVAIFFENPINTQSLHDGTVEAALEAKFALPDFPSGPAFDLLVRKVPGQGSIDLHKTGNLETDIIASLLELNLTYLAIQGPPGTGKTYTTAHIIKELVDKHNWQIGVVGQSHKVVENVLSAAIKAKLDQSKVAKEPLAGSGPVDWNTPKKLDEWLSTKKGGVLVGGTAWTFRRRAMLDLPPFDLLVIDEAGQFSLANTISMATATNRLLLVGDPQQLPQVSQANHPEQVDESALAWLLDSTEVIDPAYGYFLPQSYRMVKELCAVVSSLSYRGQLKSAPEAALRKLADTLPGLQIVPVMHVENGNFSTEEAHEVLSITKSLIGKAWTDKEGTRELKPKDIKIVAPFNAQVSTINRLLRDNELSEIQVGTVDRFQGQEAAVVILSMATSSPNEVARGLDFLLSRNRLNVAISRGQWSTYLVYSPELTNVEAKTPAEIRLVSGLLGLLNG